MTLYCFVLLLLVSFLTDFENHILHFVPVAIAFDETWEWFWVHLSLTSVMETVTPFLDQTEICIRSSVPTTLNVFVDLVSNCHIRSDKIQNSSVFFCFFMTAWFRLLSLFFFLFFFKVLVNKLILNSVTLVYFLYLTYITDIQQSSNNFWLTANMKNVEKGHCFFADQNKVLRCWLSLEVCSPHYGTSKAWTDHILFYGT